MSPTISKQDSIELKEIAELSPFEVKDVLIKIAKSDPKAHTLLNAGRGNPNFLATTPRYAYHQLGLFALSESERSFKYMSEGIGGMTQREGIEARFEIYCSNHRNELGVHFLEGAVSYIRDQMGLNAQDFLYELSEAVLGNNYPSPPRALVMIEKIVNEYLHREMCGNHPYPGKFDVFMTEGGSAAMAYLFPCLKFNHLLNDGDTIALGTPIFQPYIEIPHLKEFNLKAINIEAFSEDGWQFSHKELDKLRDPKVKAFFVINPSNPPSVRLSDDVLEYIIDIVKERPDLILLTDDVYGSFSENFVSLFACCPYNTVLVYSYSKLFGATGWRLGAVGLNQKNIFDDKIAALPKKIKDDLHLRYNSITPTPEKLKFIDRLVADSRTVALNHTAGLSTPAQTQAALLSLFILMDEPQIYKKALKRILSRRIKALYKEIPDKHVLTSEFHANYYTLFDHDQLNESIYGADFVKWRHANIRTNEVEYLLAKESGVVLLPGAGFGSSHPATRASLANLNETDYYKISAAMKKLREEFHQRYLDEKASGKWK